MKRKSVVQFSNSSWFPVVLKRCIYEFMTWFVGKVGAAKPFLPVVNEGLNYADKLVIIKKDVGAGFETLDPLIKDSIPRTFVSEDEIETKGLYIMVNSFHQEKPENAKEILRKVSDIKQPIVIVEGNNDSLWQVFGMTVIVPLTVILTAPFVNPFRVSRIIFTYLIPVLPLVTFIDGFLALFKLYAPKDLDELVSDLKAEDYNWKSGKIDNGRGGKIIYLLGHPVNNN